MASRMSKTSPSFTTWPAVTSTFQIVPARGAVTGSPAPTVVVTSAVGVADAVLSDAFS